MAARSAKAKSMGAPSIGSGCGRSGPTRAQIMVGPGAAGAGLARLTLCLIMTTSRDMLPNPESIQWSELLSATLCNRRPA